MAKSCQLLNLGDRWKSLNFSFYFLDSLTPTKNGNQRQGHYVIIKGLIHQDIIVVNIFASNIGANKYIKQILTLEWGNRQQYDNSC